MYSRGKKPFLTCTGDKLDTKLVDILEDFDLEENTKFVVEEVFEGEGFCTLLNVKKRETPDDPSPTVSLQLPRWKMTLYDLGGHSPYFNSQKLFSASSSIFLLTFQR